MTLYSRVSSFVFSLIAFVQVLRTGHEWPVEVAGRSIPIWVSTVAFVVATLLAAWGFHVSRPRNR